MATAFTNLLTRATPGATLACLTPSTSAASSLTHTTRTSCCSRPWDTPMGLTRSAASFVQQTAAPHGKRSCTKMKTLARLTSNSIPTIHKPSLPRSGKRVAFWSTYPPNSRAGAIYKSSDGGATWNQINGNGLPQNNDGEWGRVGLAIARGTHGQRVYALIDSRQGGLFRSDDGGQNWTLAGNDRRVLGRLWYFGEVAVDPRDPNTVYLPNVSIYRSTNSGKVFEAFKGAPGGDDYHAL